jgi:hypothetical protein
LNDLGASPHGMEEKSNSARLESDKKMYKTRIDALDNQIDSFVYNLYGLMEKEINIIKGEGK